MWMDAIILEAVVSADGASHSVPQEIRISLDDGMVILQCPGLFDLRMPETGFDNLYECVQGLIKMSNEDE